MLPLPVLPGRPSDVGHFSSACLTQGCFFLASVRPDNATHSPVHHHRVLHVLEQFLGLKQQRDIQNHVAVSWRKGGKATRSSLQAHTEESLCIRCGNGVRHWLLPLKAPQSGGGLPRTGITRQPASSIQNRMLHRVVFGRMSREDLVEGMALVLASQGM